MIRGNTIITQAGNTHFFRLGLTKTSLGRKNDEKHFNHIIMDRIEELKILIKSLVKDVHSGSDVSKNVTIEKTVEITLRNASLLKKFYEELQTYKN